MQSIAAASVLWADFENALAKFNARAMSSAFMVDNYLDLYDAYDEDAGAGILTRFAPERARS